MWLSRPGLSFGRAFVGRFIPPAYRADREKAELEMRAELDKRTSAPAPWNMATSEAPEGELP